MRPRLGHRANSSRPPFRGPASMPGAAMLLGLSLVCGAAMAAEPALVDVCLDCHGPDQRQDVAPVIEGQHADYLRVQLTRFQDRHRQGFPMNALSAGLQPEQIANLAEDLAHRTWPSAGEATIARSEFGAAQVQALDCAGCHGKDYRGGGSIPRLAGQQAAYLERQILGFADSERHHPPIAGGSRMYAISPEDAAAIAAALAALR